MSSTFTLADLLSQTEWDIHTISRYFNELLDSAVEEVNSQFSPYRLSKAPRQLEPLPTDRRQLSSYRTRIGTMLEYALSTAMARLLNERCGEDYLLTFVTSHEYPDFLLRDRTLATLLRIEMKAVDADSDEQAAAFKTSTLSIDSNRDMLLLVGWKWQELIKEGIVIGEYPYIFASVILPAGEIAAERDIRLLITGGKIEGEQVWVFSKKKGELVLDPDNYGKLWRILHTTRHESGELSETTQEFLRFLEKVDEHSTRKRLQKRKQGRH